MRHILILEQFEISKLEHGKTLSLSTPVGEIVLQYDRWRGGEANGNGRGKLVCEICGTKTDKHGKPFKNVMGLGRHKAKLHPGESK